ncbi:dihydropteroate synthase [Paenibacillus koleovorans]|uniref:dihydropteroate synthase n=1 Tax=Paenibacillus koleovorans TaxID=121608 RepID=UPI000FDA339C|nr:dihydropteroate synthase [Paenibacillus koleovorans]
MRNVTLIMGILNVTPDSFSDGGSYSTVDLAVKRAVEMVEQGADLIDVGGESTRPGAERVTLEEELARVVPAVEALVRAGLPVPISVDTYKAEVARQAMEAGAHIVNDIWGFQGDSGLAEVAVRFDCPVVLMHNRKTMDYTDFLTDVVEDLRRSAKLALEAGVQPDRIILDPGIGFAKTYEHNLLLLQNLYRVAELGYPVLLGTSRKSVIQKTLGLPAHEVLEGTAATVALGIVQGCNIVRVHDVREMKRVARMTDAIHTSGRS